MTSRKPSLAAWLRVEYCSKWRQQCLNFEFLWRRISQGNNVWILSFLGEEFHKENHVRGCIFDDWLNLVQGLYYKCWQKLNVFWNDLLLWLTLWLTFLLPLTVTFVSVNFAHLLGKLFSCLSCLFRVKQSKRHRVGEKTPLFYYVTNLRRKKIARRSLGSYVHEFYKLSTDQFIAG